MNFSNSIQLKMIKISTVSGAQELIKNDFFNSILPEMVKQDKIIFLKIPAVLQSEITFSNVV